MFCTRFTRLDGGMEDYLYHSRKEAESHLGLFSEDDSGLYKNVAVLEVETNTVYSILPFSNGSPERIIRIGDLVRLRPEYSTRAERKYVYQVTNLNEHTGHTHIVCLNSKLSLLPIETVGIEMIQPVFDGK